MEKQKLFIIDRNDKPEEVELVGKFIPEENFYHSKFQFVYQVKPISNSWRDWENVKREDIYLSEKDVELAVDAKNKLNQIRKAEQVIREYKDAIEVIQKAKKEGLQDLEFVAELSEEKETRKPVDE